MRLRETQDNETERDTGQSLRLKGESWGRDQSVLKEQGEDICSKSEFRP